MATATEDLELRAARITLEEEGKINKKKANSRWNKGKKRKIDDVEMEDAEAVGGAGDGGGVALSQEGEEKTDGVKVKGGDKKQKTQKADSREKKETTIEKGEDAQKKRRKPKSGKDEHSGQEGGDGAEAKEEEEEEETTTSKKDRFIVFIGEQRRAAPT